jgi:hypothetical protein
MIEYIHQLPGTEIRSISGHYTIIEEGRMNHGGRMLLYEVGVAVVDSACCGTGGCRFVHVAGYITAWRRRTGSDGQAVSDVEPVADMEDRKAIKTLLDRQFPYSQISFREI